MGKNLERLGEITLATIQAIGRMLAYPTFKRIIHNPDDIGRIHTLLLGAGGASAGVNYFFGNKSFVLPAVIPIATNLTSAWYEAVWRRDLPKKGQPRQTEFAERELISYLREEGKEFGYDEEIIKSVCQTIVEDNHLITPLNSIYKLNPNTIEKSFTEPKIEVQSDKPIIQQTGKDTTDFDYVPSIDLYVAKERIHFGKDKPECHNLLHTNNEKMLNPLEFVEFLKYAQTNLPEVYKDITEARSPWRSEWIDADFKVENGELFLHSHIFDKDGKIIPIKRELDRDTLIQNKRISLEDYIENNHTSQGLPSKNVKSGDLYYWAPMKDNNSVASFLACSDRTILSCNEYPSNQNSGLGVRAVRHV
jgi:hypothetical protein